MGLDMYLIKKKKGDNKNLWEFKEEEIYWRKANQVHNFFRNNCEMIEDEIVYKVSKDNLKELLKKCNKILDIVITKEGKIKNGQILTDNGWEDNFTEGIDIINKDEIANILPTCEGFFFGSTDYDEFYLNNIKHTRKEIKRVIKELQDDEEIYYLASW